MTAAPTDEAAHTELVLVGGGHAHVQVLSRWRARPLPGVRLTLVVDQPRAVYSGMVPGWVAGDYGLSDLEIDVRYLAERAGARVVLGEALVIDPEARCIEVQGQPPVHYDVASLDVGSSVRGLDLPGVAEHALPTRPIGRFIAGLEAALAKPHRGAWPLRVSIVGGGVAGLELAFTLEARLRALGRAAELTVLADPEILPGQPKLARAVRRIARDRGIRIRAPFRVVRIDRTAVHADGQRCVYDLAVLATGAAPPRVLQTSKLPRDPSGFVRVQETLQVVGHEELFAVGDCATLDSAPWVRKAGVYAVRMGPVLDRNLRLWIGRRERALRAQAGPTAEAPRGGGRRLRRFRPQRGFLVLLNLGGRRALGIKWGVRVRGRWVWRLKDRIDRRFMRRFRVAPS